MGTVREEPSAAMPLLAENYDGQMVRHVKARTDRRENCSFSNFSLEKNKHLNTKLTIHEASSTHRSLPRACGCIPLGRCGTGQVCVLYKATRFGVFRFNHGANGLSECTLISRTMSR